MFYFPGFFVGFCKLILFQTRACRVKQLKDDGFSPITVSLAEENEAHSDDEKDPNGGPNDFLIHLKEGRDPLVTGLLRLASDRFEKSFTRRTGAKCVALSFYCQILIFCI